MASKKRGADSGKERHNSSNNRKKTRVTIDDSDNSGDESNVLVEEVNTAINTDEEVYLDCACNKMILTSKEHMKNLQRVDKEMTTANKGKLKVKGIGEAGSFKGVYFAPEASKNLIDMKSITDKNCTVTFDGDEVIIRDKASNKTLIKQRSVNGLYPISMHDLLGMGEPSITACATEAPSDDKCILWHKRLGHVHNDKLIESDRRGLLEGINLDKKYFRKKIQKKSASVTAVTEQSLPGKIFELRSTD